MAKKPKLNETQKLVLRASYERYYMTFGTRQKALEKVAEEFGIHWQTARSLVLESKGHGDPAIIQDVKRHQANKIDSIVNDVLDDLDKAKAVFKGMSPAQAILATAQLIDKSMKLKGEDIQKIEVNEVGQKLVEKLKQLQNLKAALEKSLVTTEEPKTN